MNFKHSFFYFAGVVFGILLLAGCGPTYPRAKVADAVERIIEKEYGLFGRAHLTGTTLYLEVVMPGLTTTEQDQLSKVLEKVQGAALAVARVSLSSDAKIEFLVLKVRDPMRRIALNIIQRVDDVKGSLYQRYSRADLDARFIIEFEGGERESAARQQVDLQEKTDQELTLREFVGRLVVAQVNMLGRSNPFLGVIIGKYRLKYESFIDGDIVARIAVMPSEDHLGFFKDLVAAEGKKVLKQFKDMPFSNIRIIGTDTKEILVHI